MTKEEKIEILENEKAYMLSHGGDRQAIALDSAIKALQQDPYKDCVSRQAAIDALLGITAMRNTIPLDSAIFNIKKLPSAQPERKTGRWIPDNTDYYRTKFICSACGKSEEVPTTGFGYGTMWDYCPYCGAKMTESEDKA